MYTIIWRIYRFHSVSLSLVSIEIREFYILINYIIRSKRIFPTITGTTKLIIKHSNNNRTYCIGQEVASMGMIIYYGHTSTCDIFGFFTSFLSDSGEWRGVVSDVLLEPPKQPCHQHEAHHHPVELFESEQPCHYLLKSFCCF